ncbi:hypothetical protein Q5O89_04690 [Peribacillus frigoritolerans]|nr:hypothetical protein [Peribacillus frigoritolerans]
MTAVKSEQAIVMENVEKSAKVELIVEAGKMNITGPLPAFTLDIYCRKPKSVSCFFVGKMDGHPLSFHNFVTQ